MLSSAQRPGPGSAAGGSVGVGGAAGQHGVGGAAGEAAEHERPMQMLVHLLWWLQHCLTLTLILALTLTLT